MSPKTLFLITYEFPFLPGEYFLETEVEYLVRKFEKVYIVPYRRAWSTKQRGIRAIPSGIVVLDPGEAGVLDKARWLFEAIFSAPGLMLASARESGPRALHLPNQPKSELLRCLLKTALTHAVLRWAIRSTSCREMIVGYAYWRDEAAYALAFLRSDRIIERLFVRAHNIDLYDARPRRKQFENLLHAKADAIFPVSEDGRNYLITNKGLSPHNIHLKRLGVRLPQLCSFASSDGILRIVSCSNLNVVKRVDKIARVIGQLPGPLEWTIIGDGPELARVHEVVREYGATHVVRVIGRLTNRAVLDYYQNNPVDLFINLSTAEGVPVSIMEALAAGIPVIATDVGGSGEIVRPSGGIVVGIDADDAAISQQIVAFFADPVQTRAKRAQARQAAVESCSADANYLDFCEELTK